MTWQCSCCSPWQSLSQLRISPGRPHTLVVGSSGTCQALPVKAVAPRQMKTSTTKASHLPAAVHQSCCPEGPVSQPGA